MKSVPYSAHWKPRGRKLTQPCRQRILPPQWGPWALRAPVDAFFEAVQVNSDNEIVRRNRLNLLSQVRNTCARVADLGRIEAA